MQEVGHWFRAGSNWCRKVVTGSGLVAAGAGKWSLVQEGDRCRKKVDAGAGRLTLEQGW